MGRWTLLTSLVALSSAFGRPPDVLGTTAGIQGRERDVYVSVLDRRAGTPVSGLGAADFVVREDGVQREVLRVRPASGPMQIAILADTSEAATPMIGDLRLALQAFTKQMQGRNEFALITFGDRPTIVVDSTPDLNRIVEGIGRLFAVSGSGSYLLDALYNTLEGFQARQADRPVVLVITTEGEEFSTRHHEVVLGALAEAGAALHALVVGPGGDGPGSSAARSRSIALSNGTSASGGRWDHLLTTRSLVPKLEEVARELNNQYLVSYARPESLIPPESVTVGVTNPGLIARGTPVRVRR